MNSRILSFNNIYKILVFVSIVILVLFSSVGNFKYNNHSKNWLNHDYGKNLLSSTQEYSVFMTEGGDNQVFSSLYFTYAEKLRQDLFPYDQKGNIFKRIYGDLRYVSYNILQDRSIIVNRGLFDGEESFYVNVRSSNPPYLVPYALGKPSTYLTWRLPDQNLLGNYYYKNYGLMYKVQDIKFAIIDYVEPIGSANINEVKQYVEENLGRVVNNIELNDWLNSLVKEGLISRNGTVVNFIKSYPKPFKKNPTESFIIRWQDIPNLKYFDYLSREIVISYSYEQISFLRDQIKTLQKLYNIEDTSQTKNTIKQEMNDSWNKIQEYTSLIKTVGYDSAATLHNLGVFYLSVHDEFNFITENYLSLSIELWEMTIDSAPYFWSTYNILLWSYMKQAIAEPENSDSYLELFDSYLSKMTNNMTHFKSMKKDITKAKPYAQVSQLVNLRNNFDNFAGANYLNIQNQAQNMINNNQPLSLPVIQQYFVSVVNQLSFLGGSDQLQRFQQLWNKAFDNYKSDSSFLRWHIDFLGSISDYGFLTRDLFIKTLREGSIYFPDAQTAKSEDIQFFIGLLRIAKVTQDSSLIELYKNKILMVAHNNLPKEQFNSFSTQIDQMLAQ